MGQQFKGLVVVGGAVVLCAVVAAVYVAENDGTAAPAPTTTVTVDEKAIATELPNTPTYPGTPILGLKVAANSGGTSFAPDKFTRIGFPNTCEGAVAAAASFKLAENSPATDGARDMTAVLLAPGGGQTLKILQTYMAGTKGISKIVAPAQGGFRITNCPGGSIARVQLLTCSSLEATGTPMKYCNQDDFDMVWSNGEKDWRIRGLYPQGPGPYRAWVKKMELPFPVPAHLRKAILAEAGNGWTEFTDAPN